MSPEKAVDIANQAGITFITKSGVASATEEWIVEFANLIRNEVLKEVAAVEPYGHVAVRRLSQRLENHVDQYQFYPAGHVPYTDNVDECIAVYTAPQAQQPHRIGSGVTVEQTLAQWEHDFQHPMTTEQQADWVKREREFAASQAQQPKVNQCAETCERAKLCAACHRAISGEQPQLLTDEEIDGIVRANAGPCGADFEPVARAIEQAVLRKNGVTK